MQTAYDLVWLAGERTPNHLASVDDRTDRKLSYKDLLHEVDVVPAGLAERGVRPGVCVATILPNFFEHCIVLLAIQRLAAVPTPLNFRCQPAEIAKLIKHGEIVGAVIRDDPETATSVADALTPNGLLMSVGAASSSVPDFSTGDKREDFAKFIQDDISRWPAIVKTVGAKED